VFVKYEKVAEIAPGSRYVELHYVNQNRIALQQLLTFLLVNFVLGGNA